MLQQGVFWFTNHNEPENHIRGHEKESGTFLVKYILSVKERGVVIRDLELMGITAMQLSPCVESVCEKAFNAISSRMDVGKTPGEKTHKDLFTPGNSLSILRDAGEEKRQVEYINCPECNVKLNPKNLKKHIRTQHGE